MSLYRSKSWKQLGLAALTYTALALLFTFPLVLHMSTSVLGWSGDNLEYVWKMWWFKHAIVDAHVSPFRAPHIYYPYGLDMAIAEMTPANTILGIPLTAVFGPVLGYNAMILLSFILSGLGMHLLVSEYVQHPVATLASGIVFAFCPYRIAHSAGHLPLMGTQWIPLALWAVERWRNRSRWQWAGLVGLFFSLTVLSSWYYAVFMALALAIFCALRLRPWKQYLWRVTTIWSGLAFLVILGVLVVPFAIPYLRILSRGELAHPFMWVLMGSAEPSDFLVPNLLHPLWGTSVQSMFESQSKSWVERSIYLGWVGLFLSAVTVTVRRRDAVTQAYVAIAVITFVLALGPTLRWQGKNVTVLLPRFLQSLSAKVGLWPILVSKLGAENDRLVIPLPVQVLQFVMPGATSIRVWARIGLFTTLAVAALTGMGLDHLCTIIGPRWSSAMGRKIGWIAVILILFDFAAVPSLWPISHPFLTFVEPRAVDLWLRDQDKGVMIEFPVSLHGSQMYYSITHRQQIVTGYGTFIPQHFAEKRPILETFPSKDSLTILRDWQVRYILVDSMRYQAAWPQIMAHLDEIGDFELVYEAQGIYVYVMNA